jgi:hypothetical protein
MQRHRMAMVFGTKLLPSTSRSSVIESSMPHSQEATTQSLLFNPLLSFFWGGGFISTTTPATPDGPAVALVSVLPAARSPSMAPSGGDNVSEAHRGFRITALQKGLRVQASGSMAMCAW